MSEWKEYKLGEIGSFNNGVNKSKSSFGHGFPFVNLMDIFDKDRIDYIPHGLVDVNQDELNRYSLKDGDILFVRSSVKLDGVGKVCAVTKDLANTIYSGFIIRFRQPNLILDKFFSSYYLNSSPIRTQVISKGTLSANSNVNQESLKTIQIRIPSLPEQRQIAHILSDCDAVIEKTQSVIAKYKTIKQGMLHDLFTRGIDITTGKLRPKYEDAPALYKESKLGMVPKEWDVQIIENIGEVVTGSTPPTARREYYGDNYLFVSPSDIQENFFISKTEKMLTKEGFDICRQLPKNTICVVCIGSTIGKIAALEIEGCTNQQINAVICHDKDLSFFYFYSMLYFNEKQFRKETGLQAVPIVNKSSFSNFELPTIDKEEAIEISKRLRTVDSKLQTEQTYLHKLQMIKSGLMGDLLSGRKRVTVPEEVLTLMEN